jgi:segregation and condensation protein B
MSETPENQDAAPEAEAVPAEPETETEAGEGGEAEREPDPHHLRLLEAVLFSTDEALTEPALAERLPDGANLPGLLKALAAHYANHGVNLVHAGGRWLFRTAEDLSEELRVHKQVPRRLSRAAMETLAIVAYHQPVTRAEIEEIRGVGLSRGTLDLLVESGWVAPKGRRRTAGPPATWGTTSGFLVDFGLESIKDLPGLDDLKAAGLLDKRPAMQISEFIDAGDRDPEDDDEDGEGEEEGSEEEALGESALDEDFPDDDAFEEGVEEPASGEEDGAEKPVPSRRDPHD